MSVDLVRNEKTLAFRLPHRRLSSVDASIALRSAQARFTIKFTDNLRQFTFRKAKDLRGRVVGNVLLPDGER